MTFDKRQAGLGLIGWLLLILVVGGAVTVGLKLIPLYLDFHTMSKDLESMAATPGMAAWTTPALRQNLKNRFSIDDIYHFDLRKNITVQRSPDHVYVTMAYKVNQPLLGNVDLLVSFHKRVELRN